MHVSACALQVGRRGLAAWATPPPFSTAPEGLTGRRVSAGSTPAWFGLYYSPRMKAMQMPLHVRSELELWLWDSNAQWRLLEPQFFQLRNRDTNALQNCSDQCFSCLAATDVNWGARETANTWPYPRFHCSGVQPGQQDFSDFPCRF